MKDRYELEREYRMLEEEYHRANVRASGARKYYRRQCVECWGYIAFAGILWLYDALTMGNLVGMGDMFAVAWGQGTRMVYYPICAMYGVIVLRKIYKVYMDGYSPRARMLAARRGKKPLTLQAEEADVKAARCAARLQEIESQIWEMENKEEKENIRIEQSQTVCGNSQPVPDYHGETENIDKDLYDLEWDYYKAETKYQNEKMCEEELLKQYHREYAKCRNYFIQLVAIILVYCVILLPLKYKGSPSVRQFAQRLQLGYIVAEMIFAAGVFSKMWDIYLEGRGTRARRIAAWLKKEPLTLQAERHREEAEISAHEMQVVKEKVRELEKAQKAQKEQNQS